MNHQINNAGSSGDDVPLGLRLRQAREAKGLSRSAAAEALRMPVIIVEAMEREDIERLGAAIYVRGNYLNYARLVDVPAALVDSFCRNRSSAPQVLAPNTHVPLARVLFDRYVKRSVYVVLTASIVPSVIWLASLDRSAAPVQTLLESPGKSSQAGRQPIEFESVSVPLQTQSEAEVSDSEPALLQPVKASMAPMYPASTLRVEDPEPTVGVEPMDREVAVEPNLVIRFTQDSWFEVLSQDGARMDSGIGRAGEERRFPRTSVGKVSIGNAGGVEVGLDGENIDLTPYRRANVARFALSSAGSVLPSEG